MVLLLFRKLCGCNGPSISLVFLFLLIDSISYPALFRVVSLSLQCHFICCLEKDAVCLTEKMEDHYYFSESFPSFSCTVKYSQIVVVQFGDSFPHSTSHKLVIVHIFSIQRCSCTSTGAALINEALAVFTGGCCHFLLKRETVCVK